MLPDDVCKEYRDSGVQIRITETDDDVVVIEGTKDALKFLSMLILAQAESLNDGFGIAPNGAGWGWFMKGSTKGIYIRQIVE